MTSRQFGQEILEGQLDCRVGLTVDGAVLRPYDDSAAALSAFQGVVDAVRKHDGEGYSIEVIAGPSPEPGSPADSVWIIFDDDLEAEDREGVRG